MPNIYFAIEKKSIAVEAKTTIQKAADKAGIQLETPCGGAGTCGKCKVRVSDLEKVEMLASAKKLSDADRENNIVMACKTKVIGDVTVYTSIDKEVNQTMQIISKGKTLEVTLKNSFTKKYIEHETHVYRAGELAAIEEGDTTKWLYGLTVDIGTTTLVTALIDCLSGEEIDAISSLNPQCQYAQDVVSRINYTSNTDNGLQVLYKAVLDEINHMLSELCERNNIEPQYIYEAVYSGNTTMVHLATNTDPYSIGQYPYVPIIKGGNCISAAENGLQIASCGQIYLPPIISSYIGADIVSGVLASELDQMNKNVLFIDIGTNGEMVLTLNGKMTATSTAAGPAFEGMNITFGMRAGSGAIESFEIDEAYQVKVKTIGDKKAKGICGSGLFDIVGELVRVGVIEKNGRIIKADRCTLPPSIKDRITKYEGKAAFQITEDVYLTLMDIRQIQLAKSAIRAGIEAMIGLNEVSSKEIDLVYIAGSFGYHLKPKSLIHVGIVPAELESRIRFIGNTSKTGGSAFLLNTDCREKMKNTVKKITALELSTYPNFEALFVNCMSF